MFRKLWTLTKGTAIAWSDSDAPSKGAALAYYSAFSLAPLLLLAITIASFFIEQSTVRGSLDDELRRNLGPATATAIIAILDNASQTGGTAGMTAISLVTLLLGASGVFVELQAALNMIWQTDAPPRTGNIIIHFLRNRLLSFSAVFVLGFLLLASMIVSSVLSALNGWLGATLQVGSLELWHVISLVVSFAFATLLFALIFKLLPDVHVDWRDVWIGATLTAVLFTAGQRLIGLYLGQAGIASTFGAAGSLVVILVWVYYSAQIVLFGAQFTHVFAKAYGSRSPGNGSSAFAENCEPSSKFPTA